ncbi:MAG TPA: type I-E CRISPR-associated protein Cse2/CasB [Streptosporangiaceae bacterium]|jgi:CRISPR system Cascade subunit CasB
MTTSTAALNPSTRPPTVARLVRTTAGAYIARLQKGYLATPQRPVAVARLAQLRRGAGKLPVDVPGLWGLTGLDLFYDAAARDFPDQDLPSRTLERAETALFLAITLHALHQQSQHDAGMHRSGVGLGQAVRRLMPPADIDEPLRRRFVRVGTAETLDTLAYRLREIVSLLRRGAKRPTGRVPVPLDYALLAEQLYRYPDPDGARSVRAEWGRSFHAFRPEPDDGANSDTPADDDTKDHE